jgi:hypothetical protein
MQHRYYLPVTLVLVIVTSSLHGQSLTGAIGGGYEYGPARLTFENRDSSRWNQSFESHIGSNVFNAEVGVPITRSFSVSSQISLSSSSATFLAPLPSVQVVIPDNSYYPNEERLHLSMYRIQATILGEYGEQEGIRLAAGASFGYQGVSEYRLERYYSRFRVHVGPPTTYEQVTPGTTDVVAESRPEYSHLAFGTMVRVSYGLPITSGLALVPDVHVCGEFTPPFANAHWSAYSAGGGLSVRVGL